MIEFMYVCVCNAITEKQIHDAMEGGVEDLWGLTRSLGVASGCGACRDMASEMLNRQRDATATSAPRRYTPPQARQS